MKLGKTSICTMQGDITKMSSVDAIVNAANSSLLGGGGVDGAIHAAAGRELLEECKALNGCPTGEARITGAYNIPVKYIIHTVGPKWYGGNRHEAELLADCYKNTLQLAASRRIRKIALPSISTGIYNYPLSQAADIAVHAIGEYVKDYPNAFDEILFVLRPSTIAAYDDALNALASELHLAPEETDSTDNVLEKIGFYHEYEEYGCFSNWYPAEFDYAGRHYANSEQYMMYHKVMMFGRKESRALKRDTIERIRRFTEDRDWQKFHTPANLAKSISIEANELLECFQWSDSDYDIKHVKEELADVLVYCRNMLDELGLDEDEIVNAKMDQNEAKYPVEKARGSAAKYTSFEDKKGEMK